MRLNRRQFIGGLLASAAVQTWPFRVFSFPKNIVVPQIGGWVSYRFRYIVCPAPDRLRLRYIDIIDPTDLRPKFFRNVYHKIEAEPFDSAPIDIPSAFTSVGRPR